MGGLATLLGKSVNPATTGRVSCVLCAPGGISRADVPLLTQRIPFCVSRASFPQAETTPLAPRIWFRVPRAPFLYVKTTPSAQRIGFRVSKAPFSQAETTPSAQRFASCVSYASFRPVMHRFLPIILSSVGSCRTARELGNWCLSLAGTKGSERGYVLKEAKTHVRISPR